MKTAQMQLKVAPHIHKRLKIEAERRGISLNALAGWLFGEWCSNLERIEESARLQHRELMDMVNGKFNELSLAGIEEAQSSLDEESS